MYMVSMRLYFQVLDQLLVVRLPLVVINQTFVLELFDKETFAFLRVMIKLLRDMSPYQRKGSKYMLIDI